MIDAPQAALACDHPVERVHGSGRRVLSSFPFRGTELVHADPPCLQTTRRSDRRYRFEMTGAEHDRLPELLRALPCRVMVSGHPFHRVTITGRGKSSRVAVQHDQIVPGAGREQPSGTREHAMAEPTPVIERAINEAGKMDISQLRSIAAELDNGPE